MKSKSRIQQIVEDSPIYQQLDAANHQPGRLRKLPAVRQYQPGQPDTETLPMSLTDIVISYVFGLLGMLILAMAIAASFNFRILFGLQQAAFEALPTGLVITLLYPLILLIFSFIAYVSKVWTFAVYPVAMLALTGLFADNSFIHWLTSWLPFADVLTNGQPIFSLYAFVAVTMMIVLIYCVEKPIRELTWAADRRISHHARYIHRGILLAVVLLVAVSSVFGRPLQQSVLQNRAAVHLPNGVNMSAFNPSEQGYKLAFAQPSNLVQPNYDVLKINAVQDWWRRDTAAVCGPSAVPSSRQPAYDYMYRTTAEGTAYATALNGDTEYVCFVLGYQRYDIVRDAASYRSLHYRTAVVVSLIAAAPRYILYCDDTQALPRPNRDQRRIAAAACTTQSSAEYSAALFNRTVESN